MATDPERSDAGEARQHARMRRKRWLLDTSSQSPALFAVTGVVGAIALLQFVGARLLGESALVERLDSDEIGWIALAFNLGYFVLMVGALVVVLVRETHRFVGPALVLERAVSALDRGDWQPRLTLRKGDHLGSLAAALATHGHRLAAQAAERGELLARLDQALATGDLPRAKAAAGALRALHAPVEPLAAAPAEPAGSPVR